MGFSLGAVDVEVAADPRFDADEVLHHPPDRRLDLRQRRFEFGEARVGGRIGRSALEAARMP